MSKDRPAQESPIRDCFDFSTYGPGPQPRKAPGWATSRGRCPMSGEPKTCPARAPGLFGCCVERPRAFLRRVDPSLSRSGLGDAITSLSLPVPAAENRHQAGPARSLPTCTRGAARRASDRWRTGAVGMLPPSRKPIPRRARGLAGPANTKPRPAHAGTDQGCAGRRGDGGWGEPARHRFNVRSWWGFRVSVRFFFARPGWRLKAFPGLSWRPRAAPPGWSGPARNRPHCRWPAFAPAGRGPGAPGS